MWRGSETPKKDTAETIWIVDYDLPQNSSRRNFYRHVAAWIKEHGAVDSWDRSTQSVLITTDKDLAQFVYDEASQLGHANIYRARKVR